MSIRLILTPYGRPASEALLGEIARAKQASPLAPVTVVVPGNSVGVAVRRLLASGELGAVSSAGEGLIGVNFLTTYRLAELLAAPRLAAAGRRPVSTPVVAAAVRRVLASEPGPMFRRVASHPATEEALVGAHRELSDLDDAALTVLAHQSARASEVVRIHRLVKRQLEGSWYDEHDLMRAAHDLVESDAPLLAEIGTVVCHLPQRVSTPAARLLHAMATRNNLVVIAGITGVKKADAEVATGVARIGGLIDDDAAAAIAPAHGTAVFSTSDPDDEVRAIVRGVVDAMRDGVPLERMAVLIGNTDPYSRLLHEHLALAGIAHNGVSVRTLADSVLGRSLLRLLALPDDDFRREDVCALLAGVPMIDERSRPIPAVAWERLSRDAGIVGGVGEWAARLEHYRAGLADRSAAQQREAPDDAAADWAHRKRDEASRLQAFVEALAAEIHGAPDTWSGLARWARGIVDRWIGDEARREQWSAFEQEAARRVEAALDRLGGLDAVESGPTLSVFRRSLALELDAARDRVGRLGEGLLVGSAGLALGVELDRIWVCGLAEGVFPAPPGDDPLLADADRAALAGEMPLRADRVANDQRALLAALASTSGARVMSFPRGDLRRNTERVPSRFLLDTVEVLAGSRPLGSELPVGEPWCTAVPSFVHGLTHTTFPATWHELEVRAALAGEPWISSEPDVARSMELARARRSAAFTRFDGNLSHLGASIAARSPTAPDVTVSATRLDTWAKCPHSYFTKYLLHVRAIERPEELLQLSPLDKGNIVHETLDRFVRELIGQVDVGRPWTLEHRDRCHTILREACDEIEARGLAGKRLLWARGRRELHAQLDTYLDYDSEYRTGRNADTIETELGFGLSGSAHPAVEIMCSDGRSVRVVGSIDRVDRFANGQLAVIDYKSGSSRSYTKLSQLEPLPGGRLLQLPIYAHAARALLGAGGDDPVEASYWFVLREPRKPRGYFVDSSVEDALDRALRIIVDGIDGGLYPARPPEPGFQVFVECEYCDPDALGTSDTHREWMRKRAAPELTDYIDLIGELDAVGSSDAA